MRELAAHFDVEPTEQAVYDYRRGARAGGIRRGAATRDGDGDPARGRRLPAAGTGIEWQRLGELAGCRALPVFRLETHGATASRRSHGARDGFAR